MAPKIKTNPLYGNINIDTKVATKNVNLNKVTNSLYTALESSVFIYLLSYVLG
jgi:hypothetical protein